MNELAPQLAELPELNRFVSGVVLDAPRCGHFPRKQNGGKTFLVLFSTKL
jgi:hypothetical protein